MFSPLSPIICGKIVRYVNVLRGNIINVNLIHSGNRLCFPRKIPSIKSSSTSDFQAPLSVPGKYKIFDDADSSIIVNTSDEVLSDTSEIFDNYDEFEGLNTSRGLTGVYDVEELVEVLRKENGRDIFVAAVPTEIKYVDYICIVTGRNVKHMLAIGEFIRKLYKRKCNSEGVIPKLEGKNSSDWLAIDLGNIALHIFAEDVREFYDLETLWSIGRDFDPKCQPEESHLSNILERHEIFLHDLRPAKE